MAQVHPDEDRNRSSPVEGGRVRQCPAQVWQPEQNFPSGTQRRNDDYGQSHRALYARPRLGGDKAGLHPGAVDEVDPQDFLPLHERVHRTGVQQTFNTIVAELGHLIDDILIFLIGLPIHHF